MERQLIGAVMAVLIGLAGWNMKTVNDLQLEVRGMMIGHASQQDIQELKMAVQRLELILHRDAMEK